MHIKVLGWTEGEDAKGKVFFSSEHGNGWAVWAGQRPEVGHEFSVEIDIPGTLEWGTHILPAESGGAALREVDGRMHLIVWVESVCEDGCIAARLGDSLLLLDTLGATALAGMLVDVVPPLIVFYDTNT